MPPKRGAATPGEIGIGDRGPKETSKYALPSSAREWATTILPTSRRKLLGSRCDKKCDTSLDASRSANRVFRVDPPPDELPGDRWILCKSRTSVPDRPFGKRGGCGQRTSTRITGILIDNWNASSFSSERLRYRISALTAAKNGTRYYLAPGLDLLRG
jgi:hypothetical protein